MVENRSETEPTNHHYRAATLQMLSASILLLHTVEVIGLRYTFLGLIMLVVVNPLIVLVMCKYCMAMCYVTTNLSP